jgi:hypothetical protein
MNTPGIFLAGGILAVVAALGPVAAHAQQSDGSDYHPLQMNSPSNPEVGAGAMAAARPTGTEAVGQSTGAPMLASPLTREEVRRGAVAAAHATGTEVVGQSTGMAAVTGGVPR